MFRLWFRFVKDSRLVKDTTVSDFSDNNRTKKIFDAIDEVCEHFDLSHPVWLESNIQEFKTSSTTRFTKDNFIESIDFDYLEMSVLDEDY
ncbi:MAG: hypothetical protein K6D02_02765 [Lachnospiraceae bacterium]|nr:hypothetical protein [Lachnospiraceae bacterium]